MAVTADRPGPYAPASTVLEVIERFRHRGMPTPITGDVLERAGIAPTVIPRTMQSLITLDLISDDGRPTPTFEGLRLAPEAEYPNRVAEWLRGAYAEVFAFVDPTRDNATAVRDAFRSYQPVAQQPRMATLFLGLCAVGGLASKETSSPPVPSRPRASTSGPSKRAAKPSSSQTQASQAPRQPVISSALPPPITGMLARLPADGQGWTQGDRDKFLKAFTAVLDYSFPIIQDEQVEIAEAS